MVKISIIVPIHNSEKYIRRCIDSLLSQSLKEMEILLVDDASTDSSPDIIREYVEKFPDQIRAFYLEVSRHAGGARNVGIENAKGLYVTFVDSDDYIDSVFCELLYNKSQEEDSDIVCCDFYKGAEEEQKKWITSAFSEQMGHLDYEKQKSMLMNTGYSWGMIIRTELLRSNHILFPEKIGCEDYCMRVILFLYAKKISKVDKPLYMYIIYDSSLSHQRNSMRHFDYEKAVDWLEKQKNSEIYSLKQKDYIHIAMIRCLLQEIKLLTTHFDVLPQEDIYRLANRARTLLTEVKNQGIFYIMGFGKELELAHYSEKSYPVFCELLETKSDDSELYRKLYSLYQKRIIDQMERWVSNGTAIYIWGAGKKGTCFLRSVPEKLIEGVIDKNSKKWGLELLPGYHIISPEEIKDEQCIVVLVNRYYYSETKEKLEISNNKAKLFNLEIFMSLCNDV